MDAVERFVALLDDCEAACLDRRQPMRQTLGQVSVSVRAKFLRFAFDFQLHNAFNEKYETLCGGVAKFSAGFELSGVLREPGAQSGVDVHNRGAGFHAGKNSTDKSIRRKEEMIGLLRAAGAAKIMHG